LTPFERAVRDILDRVSLVQVVSDYVQLKKTGRTYKGLCPFHSEKTPSFNVNEEKGLFYCFGCQVGGNAVTFLEKAAGLSRIEALRRLSAMTGIPLPEERSVVDPAEEARRQERSELLKALQVAHEFFVDRLQSPGGAIAREYLASRKVPPEVARTYGLGFGGARPMELVAALERRHVSLRHAEAAGLIVRTSLGWQERFHGRLVCPVYNLDGAVVAFSARLIPPDENGPKYINSPETLVFRKGETLFGLYQARTAIRQQHGAILVEGNFDVLSLAAVGVGNVVAPMGTALTADQVRLLARFSDTVTVMFDGDEAGRKASRRAVGPLIEAGLDGRIASLPEGEDPDSLARAQGAKGVREVVSRARPMFLYLVDSLVKIHGWTPHGRRAVVDEVRDVLALERDAARHAIYQEELARLLQIDAAEIRRLLRKAGEPVTTPSAHLADCPEPERRLLELMLLHPELIGRFLDEGDAALLTHPEVRDLYAELCGLASTPGVDPVAAFVERGDVKSRLRAMVCRVLATPEKYPLDPDTEFRSAMRDLKVAALKRQLEALVATGDEDEDLRRVLQRTELKNQINRLLADKAAV